MKKLLQISSILFLLANSQNIMAQCGPVGNGTGGEIFCMYHDSVRNCLYIGGGFHDSGSDTLNYCGYWNDSAYFPMGMMGVNGTNDSVWCFVMFNGDLYAGGSFTQAGGVSCNHIARWDGTSWHPVGNGFNSSVHALCVYNGELYAGGQFTASGGTSISHIGRWNGTEWNQVGSGTDENVYSMATCFGYLFLGGDFTQAGGISANHICYWNGSGFSPLGSGITHTRMMGNASVYSLCVYNGQLYCGGRFHNAGGSWMQNLAMWDGNSWHSLGNIGDGNMSDMVAAMCVYNGELYVGGYFSSCDSWSVSNLGRWNGSSWATIGSGINGVVRALEVYNNSLYLAGSFSDAAGTSVNNIAMYSSTTGIEPSVSSPGNFIIASPNPANENVQFTWTQKESKSVTFSVYDGTGKKLLQENLGFLREGKQCETINVSKWPEGIYLFSINSRDESYAGRFSVVK